MLHINEEDKQKIRHFMEVCPEIAIGEQADLRQLGIEQLELAYNVFVSVQSFLNGTPFYSVYQDDIEKMINKLNIDSYILSGEYYNNMDSNPSQEELDLRNETGDNAYASMLRTLRTCKMKGIQPKLEDLGIINLDDE